MKTGFLLQPAGIGYDHGSATNQHVHIDVTDRLNHPEPLRLDAKTFEGLLGSRMYGKNDGLTLCLLLDIATHLRQSCRIIRILGAVQRQKDIVAIRQIEISYDGRSLARSLFGKKRRVIHNVTNEVNAFTYPFSGQMRWSGKFGQVVKV